MPKRVRIDWRKRGGKKPDNVVMVARPSRYGNHHKVGDPGVPDRATAVDLFRKDMDAGISHAPEFIDWIEALRGRDLACYCPLDEPCHADVLLELANHE